MTTRANLEMFVDPAGNYGTSDEIIRFEHGQLSAGEWDNVAALGGFSRYEYVNAILANDYQLANQIMNGEN